MVVSSHGNRQRSRGSHARPGFLKDPLSPSSSSFLPSSGVSCAQGPRGRYQASEGQRVIKTALSAAAPWPSGPASHLSPFTLTSLLSCHPVHGSILADGKGKRSGAKEPDPLKTAPQVAGAAPWPPQPRPQAHPGPQQPRLSHFLSNDISQAAAFVAMSFHPEKQTCLESWADSTWEGKKAGEG